jgi:HAD superfamily hydrolase (TIGR01490 family)
MNLALFDFDGTITDGTETFPAFLRLSVRRSRKIVGGALLTPLIAGYRMRVVSGRTIREALARVGLRGENAAVVRELGLKYASEVLPGLVRQQALDRIEWHKQRGDAVVVVSAALDVYLSHWCQSLGVDVICTELEEKNGTLTGKYVRGDCSRAEKARRIRERYDLDRYELIYAYGDTEDDREMLGLAHKKYYRWQEISAPPTKG